MIKVGIVMPCINLWDKYTKPAIQSVIKAEVRAHKHEIECSFLLIDNASTDNTQTEAESFVKVLTEYDPFSFEYKRNEQMWGFQKSVNFGVKHFFDKGFDLVLVLNNDIVLHKNAIWRLVERFNKGGVSMATCLDATGECQRIPDNIYKLNDVEKESCAETPNPCFSAFMVSRDCWNVVGEFDEIFAPAYYEDNDYHYRMKLAGHLAVTYPPAMFFHWGSATQLEALGRPLTDSANQHANYVRKWGGNPGHEVYKNPFNKITFPITSTKQNS